MMKAGFSCFLLAFIICLIALSCAKTATKTPLQSAARECQQAQHEHYLNAGLKPKEEYNNEENAVVPYRVYEGVPNFSLQDCMNERLAENRSRD